MFLITVLYILYLENDNQQFLRLMWSAVTHLVVYFLSKKLVEVDIASESEKKGRSLGEDKWEVKLAFQWVGYRMRVAASRMKS